MSFTFGAPQAAASTTPQTSSLFGNTASKPFSFGTPTQPAASTGQTGQPASGMFGRQPQTTQSSTGLFGQQTQNNAQQPASGGLFGSTPAQQPQSTSLFGSTNQQQPSTSLFGSTNTNTQQQPTSSLFGSTANANTTQQQSGGLFGNSTTQPQTSSLFGSTAQKPPGGLFGSTNQPATQTSSLFGQQPQQQQQTSSLFGNNASTGTQQQGTSSLFGQQSTTAQLGGLFGQSNQAGQQSSIFGSTLGQPQQQQQQQQQQQSLAQSQVTQLGSSLLGQPKQEVDIGTRIQNVKNAWDTNHPDCRLKYYFYNVVEPGTAGQYGRPAGATDEVKWMRAQRENPDPSSMIPVLATGWNDVKKRVQLQEQMAAIHQARMKEINGALAELTRQTNLSSSIRLQQLQLQLTSLLHRLLRVVASLPNVNSVVSGGPETSRDIDTREKLIGVQNELDGKGRLIKSSHSGPIGVHTPKRRTGGGEGRLLGQVNELWGAIEELRRRRRGVGLNGDGEQFDKYQLDRIAEVLAQQQKALQALTELMKDALFDSDVMRNGLGIA